MMSERKIFIIYDSVMKAGYPTVWSHSHKTIHLFFYRSRNLKLYVNMMLLKQTHSLHWTTYQKKRETREAYLNEYIYLPHKRVFLAVLLQRLQAE